MLSKRGKHIHFKLHLSHTHYACCVGVRLRSGLAMLFFARRVLHGTSIHVCRSGGAVRYFGQLPPIVPNGIPLSFAWGTCTSQSGASNT